MSLKFSNFSLQYDSVHGKYPGTVVVDNGKLIIDGKPITVSNELDPSKIQWGAAGADYIVEAAGRLLLFFPFLCSQSAG